MNNVVVALGIEAWKPILGALLLPPVPLLVLVLIGARVLPRHRRTGWCLALLGVLGIWASASAGVATWVERVALRPPPPLTPTQVLELHDRVKAGRSIAIIVLGGGRELRAPEYGTSNLGVLSVARLRYALWLARQTGAPVGYTGGVGYTADDGPSEAQIAARIAQREFDAKLRWVENDSRDTRENAVFALRQLKQDRVDEIVLVSHGWHLVRGVRNFELAAGGEMRIVPAPMGLAPPVERALLRWLPTHQGFSHMRFVSHELLGLLAGS